MATSVWKGHLTFGLVSLPVKLYSAARAETVGFNQLHKADGSRIKQVIYCQAEDKPVPRSELAKGYEYEKGRYVVIEDEEIKKVAPPTARSMEILEFVKSSEVDPLYFESSYYMAPDEAGEKPYALLFTALKQTAYVGIAKIAMHNREHIVILRPGDRGILLHTMYFTDEIRKVDEFRTETHLVKENELKLANTLIDSLAAPFEPQKYHDEYRANLMKLIEAKKAGEQVVETPPPAHMAPVVDIMDALKKSLEKAQSRKPVQSVALSASAGEAPKARSKRQKKTG